MASHCPKCGHQIDTQANFDCSKCGDKFWQSKEIFNKRELKSSLRVKLKNTPILPIYPWGRVFISPSFSEYVLKAVACFGITAVFVTLISLTSNSSSSEIISGASIYWVLMYWGLISVGYIYGLIKCKDYNQKLREYRKLENEDVGHFDLKPKKINDVKNNKLFCLKCNKKVDSDSNYCIYCGSKIETVHHNDH